MTLFSKKTSPYFLITIALILFRALLNYAIPLMDKTEARYAEIARIMAETNNWITPQIDYGVPFWAKPPLSTWLSALSFELFGVNEFAARLPYLLLCILIALLIGKYAKRKGLDFFIPAVILFTIPEFLIHAGVVSTDTALAFCVTLVMISFWEGIHNKEQRFWKYLFFVGVGLGLLAKGPIIIILTGPPIFIWLILSKEFKNLWKSFPWIIGVIITALVAIPWYYFAEQKSPGFIDYFIVGEHFKRFLSSGWQGDKYGFPKSQPFGIIWIFLIVFAIPWIVIAIKKLWQNKPEIFKNKWVLYLFLWLVWTPLFFTISKSLIHPYIMPIMVPIALLITHWWKDLVNKNRIVFGSLLFPTIAFLLLIGLTISGKKEFYMNSDKYLIENISEKNLQIYHWQKKSYSGQFYTQGAIKAVKDTLELNKLISEKKPFLMIIPHKKIKKIDKKSIQNLEQIDSNNKKGMYIYK
ncbi:MAG: phospholipid carrier-dependent glycosyltransferase [Lutibacter sp.]|uniref:ArnT family glycosyltransferase n=1 Tax=Lutibacter sp. TaxID=1925666 RepID=UPI001A01D6D1|nr:glycosyltransferase family 39 protein [Lutibacter sp.]NOR29098.1 phospholipid carrier-dependent glycosyltransferase [Lutibacter sp.]